MTRNLARRSFSRYRFVPRPSPAEPPAPSRNGGGWRCLLWALLAAGLVFCHGCHGDEDNELCVSLTPQARPVDQDTK
jgi:hypothetical protein